MQSVCNIQHIGKNATNYEEQILEPMKICYNQLTVVIPTQIVVI